MSLELALLTDNGKLACSFNLLVIVPSGFSAYANTVAYQHSREVESELADFCHAFCVVGAGYGSCKYFNKIRSILIQYKATAFITGFCVTEVHDRLVISFITVKYADAHFRLAGYATVCLDVPPAPFRRSVFCSR